MSDLSTPNRWRVLDTVTAAVLAVAVGVGFAGWNLLGGVWFTALDALTPGLAGLVVGPWLIGGVLGGLIIQKPGAAFFVELLAATVSALLGSQWGVATLYSGAAQGLGAELIFLATRYRRPGLGVAVGAGAAAAAAAWVLELFTSGNLAKTTGFLLIYLGSIVISGVILAGAVGWLLVSALAKTGVLDRFPVGRQSRS